MTVTLAARRDISLAAARRVGWESAEVRIGPEALSRMAQARAAFERLIEDPEVTIYGVTSGYGQYASVRLTPDDRLRHARRPPQAMQSSAGEAFPERVA